MDDLVNLISSITDNGNGGTLVTFNAVTNQFGSNGTIDFVHNPFNALHTTVEQHLLDLVDNQMNHISVMI